MELLTLLYGFSYFKMLFSIPIEANTTLALYYNSLYLTIQKLTVF